MKVFFWPGIESLNEKRVAYSFHAERRLATITLAVREDLPKKSELSIEIRDIEGSTAQAQIVNGK